MIGPRTKPENRPSSCGDCWAFPQGQRRGECDKGGGARTADSKGCSWGMRRGVKDQTEPPTMF